MSEEEQKSQIESAEKQIVESPDLIIDIDEMVKAGVYFGHRKSRGHPKMQPFLYGVKNNVHIIDLQRTAEKLKEALEFLQETVKNKGKILFVGTKIQTKDLVKEIAQTLEMPYISERWLGGFLTNFPTMLKRIEYFKELERKKESGEFEKSSRREQIRLSRELKNLEEKFGGVKSLERLPQAIFITDLKKEALAAKEARRKQVKTVAICDTNTDPSLVDYPIPANDDAISSIKYILEKVKEAILKSKIES